MSLEPSGLLVAIAGPSGVGKTTVIKKLIDNINTYSKNGSAVFSISVTSRTPRGSERDGVDYHFWSLQKCRAELSFNQFIEHSLVDFGNGKAPRFYGTLYRPTTEALQMGKILLADVDYVGARQLRIAAEENSWNLLDIFINPPSIDALEERIRDRGGMTEGEIQARLHRAHDEVAHRDEFSFNVQNEKGRLDRCIHEIQGLIGSALLKKGVPA